MSAKPKKHKGRIRMSRYSGSGQGIHVEIIDEVSRIHFLDGEMTLAAFADLLTNHEAEIEFELRGIDLVGMKREHKTVEVPCPNSTFRLTPEQCAEILEPYEVDGWKGRPGDLNNMHNKVTGTGKGKSRYRVVFVRHVPASPEEAEESE